MSAPHIGQVRALQRAAQLEASTGVQHRAKLYTMNALYWADQWWDVQVRTSVVLFGRWRTVESYDTVTGERLDSEGVTT